MIDHKKIATNASSSIVQTIVAGITTFILFKLILLTLGSEKLGIWALVLAVSSMVQVANLGMSGSIVKNVADRDALGDKENMAIVIQTAVISMGLFSLTLIVGAYPLIEAYIHYAINANLFYEAKEILPIAMLAFLVTMVGSIYQGALYGCHLIVQRNWVLMADSVLYLLLSVLLMPRYGLLGLAYARFAQNCFTLMFTLILLKQYIPQLPLLPLNWSKAHFKEMVGFATNFQLISLLVLLSDPITKGFLSKFGTISMVGFYEIANRLVQIFRSLLINANQVLVPQFSRLDKLAPEKISITYINSYRVIYYLAVPGFCLLAASAPLFSELLLGRHESFFIWSTVALCMGWLLNSLAVPAYFASIGTGDMKANVISHVAMTLVNLILIYLVGQIYHGAGVVLAWSSALAIGGIVLNWIYYRSYKISWRGFIPQASYLLTGLCILGLLIDFSILRYLPDIHSLLANGALEGTWTRFFVTGAPVMIFAAVVGISMWTHPIRRKLWSLVGQHQSAKSA